jgi:hypothetical protein
MRAQDIYPKYRLWAATLRIEQPNYTEYVDATVTAENLTQARRLMKAQYSIADHSISNIREVR